jgi:hypothetical protein
MVVHGRFACRWIGMENGVCVFFVSFAIDLVIVIVAFCFKKGELITF